MPRFDPSLLITVHRFKLGDDPLGVLPALRLGAACTE
jgi:hypothetical protein